MNKFYDLELNKSMDGQKKALSKWILAHADKKSYVFLLPLKLSTGILSGRLHSDIRLNDLNNPFVIKRFMIWKEFE
jgi:hypothetical protein